MKLVFPYFAAHIFIFFFIKYDRKNLVTYSLAWYTPNFDPKWNKKTDYKVSSLIFSDIFLCNNFDLILEEVA